MDSHTPQQRHANMAAIHGKDTKPEMVVRKWLWGHGFRYQPLMAAEDISIEYGNKAD